MTHRPLTLLEKFSYLSFFCILGITVAVCVSGALVLASHLVEHDANVVGALARLLVTRSVPAEAFTQAPAPDRALFEPALEQFARSEHVKRLMVYDGQRRVLWSDDASLIGRRFPNNAELAAALKGVLTAHIVRPSKDEHLGTLRSFERLEEMYIPVQYPGDGRIVGVLEIYRDPPAFFALLDRGQTLVWILGGAGSLVLYLALFMIVRNASRTQARLEGELSAHARALEARVEERTRELSSLYREMKTTKEYLENLIESSVDGIVTLSPRGEITFASQGARRMFGCPEEAVLGTPARTYWASGTRDYKTFRRLLVNKGRLQNYETELHTPRGGILAASISASLLRNAAGEVIGTLAIVRDVTSLRKLHEQIVRSERLAAGGLLAAGVAHEVGNPLACISSLTQVLLACASDPEIRRGLEDIQLHVGRIGKIVQDLARITQPAPLEIRESSLEELVRGAVGLARHDPSTRAMKIETLFDPALPGVHVARDRLVQVFLNLILNSADAGGELRIRAVSGGDAVRVIFEDTGRGMSDEELRRVFDPFYSTKSPERHRGLGLFVSHEIVRQHGGTLVANSRPGYGCTMTITLPVERAPVLPETAL